jgi:hypothetical protein
MRLVVCKRVEYERIKCDGCVVRCRGKSVIFCKKSKSGLSPRGAGYMLTQQTKNFPAPVPIQYTSDQVGENFIASVIRLYGKYWESVLKISLRNCVIHVSAQIHEPYQAFQSLK